RAGYIRRAAPGGFTWLPLGWIVFQNVERIVREEMVRAGFQEVHFPALLPREPYEITGRWTEYGDGVFRVKDRKGADFMLAPTHEEMFTLLVKDLYSSYKDLPLSLFQIQTKYRDEARPRAGLLRGREFVMKDSYSFDLDEDGFKVSYAAHRAAYQRTFARLGLPYVIVAAMSGAMGGSASEEFLAPMEVGEDTFVRCTNCDYAANTEAVRVPVPSPIDVADAPPARVVDTPATPTIQTLVDLLNGRPDLVRSDRPWTAADTLKNVVLKLRHPDRTVEVLAIGLPGDRDVDMKRLEAQVAPAELEPFTEDDFAANPLLVRGYIGPEALGADKPAGVRYLLDPRVSTGTQWVTGANVTGNHVLHLTAGRDFTADGTIEAAEVRAGDQAPDGSGPLALARGIEMGHIFQLGRKYADALDLKVLDENGKLVTVTMGSYGVGVSRAVAAVAEYAHDGLGLIWPAELAPYDVHLVAAGKDEAVLAASESLYDELIGEGFDVLFDDRPGKVSPGVKFKDAELIGVPTIVVVGRGVVDGVVEVKDRKSGERTDVPLAEVIAHLRGN
ncbi:MAG: Prolyl-tRNA synthetase, bacterial type, partial [Aeromicrobium sp.]|nr:Prolyl-tRNA synthetase, bacterial type [Aeromicrobium sp.]